MGERCDHSILGEADQRFGAESIKLCESCLVSSSFQQEAQVFRPSLQAVRAQIQVDAKLEDF
jgi:hypothetical protein